MIDTPARPKRGRAALGPALELVHTGHARTRAVLTGELGVTRTTAGAVLTELEALGLVTVDTRPAVAGGFGRPSHQLTINEAGPVVLTGQVYVDGFRAALVGLGGRLVATTSERMTVPTEPSHVLGKLLEAGLELLRGTGRRCLGAGLAVPSAVTEPEGLALNPLHVAWVAGSPVLDIFTERVAAAGLTDVLGCHVGNDINLAALAEHRHGAGRGIGQLLMVATGHQGVGGALILDGRLHTGSSGLALEVGHLTVNPRGRACHCGGRGCLDVEVDPLAFLEEAGRTPSGDTPPLAQAVALLADAEHDRRVARATDRLVDRLALGLASLVNVLNPGGILLGGLHAYLLAARGDRLRTGIADRSLWGHSGSVPVLASALEHNSLIGAAELAWQPVLADPLVVLGHSKDG